MLFHVDFSVEYSADMTQGDLFDIWSVETQAALDAKKSGVVVDLWKVIGERKVIAIVDVESMELLDQILLCLLYTSPSPRDVEESRMPSSA